MNRKTYIYNLNTTQKCTRTKKDNADINDAGRHFCIYILKNWLNLDETWHKDGRSGKNNQRELVTAVVCLKASEVLKPVLVLSGITSAPTIMLTIAVMDHGPWNYHVCVVHNFVFQQIAHTAMVM